MARAPKKDYDAAKIPAVIKLLEDGCTKKLACETLGIAYNVKRLSDIIEQYTADKERDNLRRKQKRGTPIEGVELESLIEGYLNGAGLTELSQRLCRPSEALRMALWRSGALLRNVGVPADPLWPAMMPDQCYKQNEEDKFELGEMVWVSGYGCVGEIRKDYGNGSYRVYLLDSESHRNVSYHWYDLGSLKHLEALGVNLKSLTTSMSGDEIKEMLYNALKKANMNARRD